MRHVEDGGVRDGNTSDMIVQSPHKWRQTGQSSQLRRSPRFDARVEDGMSGS